MTFSAQQISIEDYQYDSANSLESLFGAYQFEETAEEIIEGIKAAKGFNKNIEPL